MITKRQLQIELDETRKDLEVFQAARDLLRKRVREVVDEALPRALPSVADWSGTDCVLGGLDMSVHALERTVEELKAAIEQMPDDPPPLRLVENPE